MKSLDRRISTNNGYRLKILTQKAPLPTVTVDETLINVMKLTMSRLYDVSTNVMNLSKFSEAQEFRSNGIYLPVNRPQVLKAIFQIIRDNTPNIVALNLSDNKIAYLGLFNEIENCQSLKALDLSKNKVISLSLFHSCFTFYLFIVDFISRRNQKATQF